MVIYLLNRKPNKCPKDAEKSAQNRCKSVLKFPIERRNTWNTGAKGVRHEDKIEKD